MSRKTRDKYQKYIYILTIKIANNVANQIAAFAIVSKQVFTIYIYIYTIYTYCVFTVYYKLLDFFESNIIGKIFTKQIQ